MKDNSRDWNAYPLSAGPLADGPASVCPGMTAAACAFAASPAGGHQQLLQYFSCNDTAGIMSLLGMLFIEISLTYFGGGAFGFFFCIYSWQHD